MSIAQYVDLLICPSHIADAAKTSRMGLSILINQAAFLESFSIEDAAFMLAMNDSKTVERYLGENYGGMKYHWGIKSDAESKQFHAIKDLSKATSIQATVESQYLQAPSPTTEGKLFEVQDLGNGVVVLIVRPGAIYSLRNDNYLMTVLHAVVGRMFAFVPIDKLIQYNGSSGEMIKRYFNLAAFTNSNLPPHPVFA